MSTGLKQGLTEAVVRDLSASRDEPDWLLERRLDALSALDELDLPDVIQTPGRRWTNLTDLSFESLVDPLHQADETERVTAEGVEVLTFEDALDEHEALIREELGATLDPESNYLTALSAALFTTGTLVYVPEGVDAEDVKIRSEMRSDSLFSHTLVVTERNASVTILESIGDESSSERAATEERSSSSSRTVSGDDEDAGETGDEAGRYFSNLVEVAAGENSNVQFGSLQNLSQDSYCYTLKHADAGAHATVNWIEGNFGTQLTRSDVESELNGEGSESQIVGAFFGHEDQHFDVNARVWHNAEHTTADLVTRGVLDDVARSVYEGVQDVGREAWDTSSYQRENTLMLSDDSEADASPKLIIKNHDTEASHSATVGQVDQTDLFYMTSRGIGPHTARNMLVEGFFVPVLEEIAVDEFRDDVEDLVIERLE